MGRSEQVKAGEEELSRVFFTTLSQLGRLCTFYSVMLSGLPSGAAKQILEMTETCDESYANGTMASWLKEPKEVDSFYALVHEQMSKVQHKIASDSKKALDAVTIVFAHGILDASVYGYLEVLSLASPGSFLRYVNERKVSLSEIQSQSYDQLLRGKLQEFMRKDVEYGSLLYKVDKLHEIAAPTNTQLNKNYKYDRKWLEQFDTARHEIVHGNDWTSYPIDFPTALFYWNLLNSYFLRVVIQTTGLKLSEEGAKKYLVQT